MENLIHFIKQNISKLHLRKGQSWSYEIDLRNSCIRCEDILLRKAIISGQGSLEEMVKVEVFYAIYNDQIHSRCKNVINIQEAIEYVWNFDKTHSFCRECCKIQKRNQECGDCIFYKAFMDSIQKQEICGICRDPTFRYMLPCGHYFHRFCLYPLMDEDPRCPLCRSVIPESFIVEFMEDHQGDLFDPLPPAYSNECVYSDDES